MSFSLDFSSPISTGDFQCLDDYMLSHSVNEYKTYSDLCSLSLSSITSLQTFQSKRLSIFFTTDY